VPCINKHGSPWSHLVILFYLISGLGGEKGRSGKEGVCVFPLTEIDPFRLLQYLYHLGNRLLNKSLTLALSFLILKFSAGNKFF
jgi:hypothetical protein